MSGLGAAALPDEHAEGHEDAVDLSVVIVSYNTAELLRDCLSSIFAETSGISFEVVVVDNASTDASAAMVAEQFPAVELVALGENLGFARACNLGAERARGRDLLLLNPDTVVLDGALHPWPPSPAPTPRPGSVGAGHSPPTGR